MVDVKFLPFCEWSIRPEADEPAHGYYTRLAALNGATSVITYSTVIDVNSRYIVPEDLLSVVEDLPIGETALSALVHSTAVLRDGEYTLCGQVFVQRDLSFATRRRCPACIHEKAYHRAWWDIVMIERCPYHGLEIVDVDPTGRQIGWWWPDFAVTQEGHDLGVAGVARELRHGFGRYMLGRLGYEPPSASPFLDGLKATEVIDLCHLFGRLLANDWARTAPERDCDTMDHGYRALAGGLAELRGHIGRWLLTAVPKDVLGGSVAEVMSWANGVVRAIPNRKLSLALRNAMRGALSDIVVGEDESGSDTSIYVTEAAVRLGVDRGGLYNVVNALAGGKSDRRRKLRLTLPQVEALGRHVSGLMTRTAAAKAVGLQTWDLATSKRRVISSASSA